MNRKEQYWRQRFAKEQKAMTEQVLVAQKTMSISGKKFPRGSILPEGEIGKYQLQAMLNAKPCAARYERKEEGRQYAQPVPLPPPTPPDPTMTEAEIDSLITHSDDVVADFYALVAAIMQKLGCNETWAKYLIDRSTAARDVRRLAGQVATAAKAKKLGVPSCPAVVL